MACFFFLLCVFTLFGGSLCSNIGDRTLQERESRFTCPDSNTDFYPADNNCTGAYFTCVNGVAYPQYCPGITVFDPVKKTCVSLEKASCYVPPFVCPTADGFFPVPGKCGSKYYICVDNQTAVAECPFNAVFDPVTYNCVAASDASCNQPYTCQSDGLFPYPDACSGIYYNCTGGTSTLLYCPGGYVFDPVVLTCVLTEDASCTPGGTATTSTTTETTSTTTETTSTTTETTSTTTETTSTTTESTTSPTTTEPPTTTFQCPSNGYFPIPGNCTSYYICNNGVLIVAPCPEGLVFNEATGYCDLPENVPNCTITLSYAALESESENKNSMVGSYFSAGQYEQLFDSKRRFVCPYDGFFPLQLNGEFSAYYACVGGVAYPKACPGITVFDPSSSKCVLTPPIH